MTIQQAFILFLYKGFDRLPTPDLQAQLEEGGWQITAKEVLQEYWDHSNGSAVLIVKMEDGTEKTVFWYYHDELKFEEKEFIGKTVIEAHDIWDQRDLEYLRS